MRLIRPRGPWAIGRFLLSLRIPLADPGCMSRDADIEERVGTRYSTSIPALLRGENFQSTGIVHNVSESGALVTNVTRFPPVGKQITVRLMAIQSSLRTSGPDTVNVDAMVVRHDLKCFAVRFVGGQRELRALLRRAFGRGAIDRQKRE